MRASIRTAVRTSLLGRGVGGGGTVGEGGDGRRRGRRRKRKDTWPIPVELVHEPHQFLYPAQLCGIDCLCPVGHECQDGPQLQWAERALDVIHKESLKLTVARLIQVSGLRTQANSLTGIASMLFSTRAKNFSGVPMVPPSSYTSSMCVNSC